MYDLDAIEAINVDQIVTATDRLLLGALSKRRPVARGSSPDLAPVAPHVPRAASAAEQPTVCVRGPQLGESLTGLSAALIALSLVLCVAVTFARLLV